MAGIPITVPHMGVVEFVCVIEWLRADGDRVAAGEPVVTIETEKAETEIEAPAAGRLEVVVAADAENEVPVGTVLGTIVS